MLPQSVKLLAATSGIQQSFRIDHAERLLRMPNSGWVLPADSGYEYDPATGLRKKKVKAAEPTE